MGGRGRAGKTQTGEGIYHTAKCHPITVETREWWGRGANFMMGWGCPECGGQAGLQSGNLQWSVILQSKILPIPMAQRTTGEADWTWRTWEGRAVIAVLRMMWIWKAERAQFHHCEPRCAYSSLEFAVCFPTCDLVWPSPPCGFIWASSTHLHHRGGATFRASPQEGERAGDSCQECHPQMFL